MKTKELMFVSLMGVLLIGVILMAATPKPELPVQPVEQAVKEVVIEQHGEAFKAVCSCYTHTGNYTFSGTWPKSMQTLAIRFQSPLVKKLGLKMGDKVWIQEFENTFIVEDRLPDKWIGRDFDIFMDDHDICVKWGIKILTIEKI